MVKTSSFKAVGVGSTPVWGAKIPHASGPKNPKQKQYQDKFNKDIKNDHTKKNYLKKYRILIRILQDLPGGSDNNAGVPGSGRSPGEGNGNPLQYSCLENPIDGGTWWATVHGITKSQTQLSDFHFISLIKNGERVTRCFFVVAAVWFVYLAVLCVSCSMQAQ